jgi:hypothetical protein
MVLEYGVGLVLVLAHLVESALYGEEDPIEGAV